MTLFCFADVIRISAAAVLLPVISIRDVRTRQLPMWAIRLLAAASMLRLLPHLPELSIGNGAALTRVLCGMLSGGAGTFLFLLGVTRLADRLFRKETFGGGDIRLAAALGLHLGLGASLSMLLAASLLALPEAFIRKRRGEHGFPFAPYLAAAGWVMMLLN